LRTGSASVVQGIFPLLFVVLFLSSAFFPATLMLEPAASVAQYNPCFIVDGIREPVISGFTGHDMFKAAISVLGIAALGLWLSAIAVRARARSG
jgi:ABC-2 type transport system permease protein